MFDRLLQKLTSMMPPPPPPPGERFGDPLAQTTAWTPLRGGGTNFRTHLLVETQPGRLEFRAAMGAKVFSGIFLAVGVGLILLILFAPSPRMRTPADRIVPILAGLLFASIGGALLYFGTAPIVFDGQLGCFWKGRRRPDETFRREDIKVMARLDQIHALQIVSERCHGKKRSYYSYELNLVLHDGARLNVIDHGDPAFR